MPGPYPLATLAVTIDQYGISGPPFEDILASLQASYRQIYGDVYLEPDSQDGQWLAVQAQAIYDVNQAVIAAYNSYSPVTSLGIGLSSTVKINGLRRLASSNSTVDLVLVGQPGTVIANGVVSDGINTWNLPLLVTMPLSGEVTVTGTCAVPGNITAQAGTVTQIVTQIPGWQTVTNPQAAFPGLPVETDARLRQRQALSTALPAITPRESIQAAVANLAGVGRCHVYSNDTDIFDVNGIPPHSIAVVVEGGDATQIATAILLKKNLGAGTWGDYEVVVYDSHGVPQTIDFFYLNRVAIFVTIALQPLTGYLDTTAPLIIDSVNLFINSLTIYQNVYVAWLYPPANLSGDAAVSATGLTQAQLDTLSATYVVRSIEIGTSANAVGTADVIIPYNNAPSCNPGNVTVSLVI